MAVAVISDDYYYDVVWRKKRMVGLNDGGDNATS